jgi:hypothetical protein
MAPPPYSHTYDDELEQLERLLCHLPPIIPSSANRYQFKNFGLDPEDFELAGTMQGALNAALERAFGRRDLGPIILTERGPSLEAVVPVLRDFITGEDGENILLIKWIRDLVAGAKATYELHGEKVNVCSIY